MALNAPQDTGGYRESGEKAGPNRHPAPPAAAVVAAASSTGELRIYQHSNLLYWWPIWAYGLRLRGPDIRAGHRRAGAGRAHGRR